MNSNKPINLEDNNSDDKIKQLLKLKGSSFYNVFKLKFYEVTLKEIITHIITLIIIIPYIYLLSNNIPISDTFDTIGKLVIGAYISSIVVN